MIDFTDVGFQRSDAPFQVFFNVDDPLILDASVLDLLRDGIVCQIRCGVFHAGFRQITNHKPVFAAQTKK